MATAPPPPRDDPEGRRAPLPIPDYREPPRNRSFSVHVVINLFVWSLVIWAFNRYFLTTLYENSDFDDYTWWFAVWFTWRYLRFFVSIFGWLIYKPAPYPLNPQYRPEDVTVILPTIDPTGEDFQECLRSICLNDPFAVFVVTAGPHQAATEEAVEPFAREFPHISLTVSRANIMNKRAQVAVAIPQVRTRFTIMLDDHVFWKPGFLRAMLAAFEADDEVGIVGTNKAVRRAPGGSFRRRVSNLIGSIYLYRHNFEVRSANAIDGGAFVISARTCGLRTEIIQQPDFIQGYTNEMFFFGLMGPLNPDDDNYNTRYCVKKGWKIKWQETDDNASEIETTIGVVEPYIGKLRGQVSRWARTTWRSNPASLFTERAVWAWQPWSVYSIYLTSFTNFAVITDLGLAYLLYNSYLYQTRFFGAFGKTWYIWLSFISFTLIAKTIKALGYWVRHPEDLVPWWFVAISFSYIHSWYKFIGLVTFYNHAWSGRNLTTTTTTIITGTQPTGTQPTGTATRIQTPAAQQAEVVRTMENARQQLNEVRTQAITLGLNNHSKMLQSIQGMRADIALTKSTHANIQQQQKQLTLEVDDLLNEFVDALNTVAQTYNVQNNLVAKLRRVQARVNRMVASGVEITDLVNSAPPATKSGDSDLGDRIDGRPPAGRGRRPTPPTPDPNANRPEPNAPGDPNANTNANNPNGTPLPPP
ncbi:nucleotide-diphospho-sugar transferase [Podospora fimiseda]|uniref:Nucleotide-diphospho-sugar transferase n=1 Tax=Podospora fimiseda TaxID=252190 RepID=A0AAN7BYI4_9PEZI|nr:nucleotide-diphospho-sugar transferase [Podospora fimiseda]